MIWDRGRSKGPTVGLTAVQMRLFPVAEAMKVVHPRHRIAVKIRWFRGEGQHRIHLNKISLVSYQGLIQADVEA
jgi:hypothetical protein